MGVTLERHNLHRRPFRLTCLSEVLSFAASANLAPNHQPSTIKRFLEQLITSPSQVIDIFDSQKRVATAVLLDKIQNPGNSACLEFLGMDQGFGSESLEIILVEAESEKPKGKTAIELTYHSTHPFALSVALKRGYLPYYDVFDMKKNNTVTAGQEGNQKIFKFKPVTDNFSEYYKILTQAFTQNLETSIPPEAEMKLSYKNRKIPVYLLEIENHDVGFFNVAIDESDLTLGELHTIGLLPAFRGKNLGQVLLAQALLELQTRGAKTFKLTVAATNDKALKLYETFGFRVVDKHTCFRKPFGPLE